MKILNKRKEKNFIKKNRTLKEIDKNEIIEKYKKYFPNSNNEIDINEYNDVIYENNIKSKLENYKDYLSKENIKKLAIRKNRLPINNVYNDIDIVNNIKSSESEDRHYVFYRMTDYVISVPSPPSNIKRRHSFRNSDENNLP